RNAVVAREPSCRRVHLSCASPSPTTRHAAARPRPATPRPATPRVPSYTVASPMAEPARNAHAESVGAIRAPKLASVVARRIEDEIVASGWPVGEVLGSETELLDRFGVSRAVLREAVRIIEHSGAARMRRGPGGGLIVTEPNRDAVVAAISIWFSYVGITAAEIIEAWAPL